MKIILGENELLVTVSGESTYHITLKRRGVFKESGLTRYGILSENNNATFFENENEILTSQGKIRIDNSKITLYNLNNEKKLTGSFNQATKGFDISFDLNDDEKLYGLGDVTRDGIDKRGYKTRMWVTNVKSYAPIPFLMSTDGWAIMVNTTFDHFIDVGSTNPNVLRIFAEEGDLDFYLFIGNTCTGLLDSYTDLSGKPVMLPKWAFGLTFVCNTNADDSELVSDALNFRREDIPCDLIGLEPGWMERNYDGSVNKKWNDERFPIPSYVFKGPNTFIGAIDRLGFKLSLWLCCDYDVSLYEELLLDNEHEKEENKEFNTDSFEKDEHFTNAAVYMDRVTVPKQPWFEHLKKFVDQGVSAFKLDGAYQVLDHPDRLYGNGMGDKEMHNLYPVLLNKQMAEGFSEHTRRRAMIYSAGGYAGIQRYSATWAGDTGGGFKPLVSMLNHGLSGHSNTSCDMDIFSIESIHFGFLQPWSQLNSWNYWRHPWLLADADKENFRNYTKLRYSIVPYLYTAAHQAAVSGIPIMRAMLLVFSDEGFDNCLNQYMLGDSFLVGVFLESKNFIMQLPGGIWHDFWTGEIFEGPGTIEYKIPYGKGGALLVKDGSIIPTVEPRNFIGDQTYDSYILHVYGEKAKGEIYNDDGISLDYLKGENCILELESQAENECLNVFIHSKGNYRGMPEKINYSVVTHGFNAKAVIIND